ncbi:MAG: hypothetical protein QW291_07625 [Thermofilaceae archaeon]
MEINWKLDMLKEMGVTPINLRPRDWVLLLLHVGGRNPIKGEESFHTTLFMMQCPPVVFKTLLLSVFSPEIHQAIEHLIEEGLIKREYKYEGSKLIEIYSLSPLGVEEASRLAEKASGSYMFIGGAAIRKGDDVLSELEALKKTYNGRGLKEGLKLILDKLGSKVSDFESPLEAFCDSSELDYMKKLFKIYREEF